MALLFDEAQGAFKDTGSQTSPMKKSTGMMRKQMTKMDEVAPRGHMLAYITPGEAKTLEVDLIIGADGANSRVAKAMGAGDYNVAIAFQERIKLPQKEMSYFANIDRFFNETECWFD